MKRILILLTLTIFLLIENAICETLIFRKGEKFKYFEGYTPLNKNWNTKSFDDNLWKQAISPFIYETIKKKANPSEATIFKTVNEISKNFPITYYFRKNVTISENKDNIELFFDIDIEDDDGFVFYINGKPIVKSFVESQTPFDKPAKPESEKLFNKRYRCINKNGLNQGENLIAVEIHRSSLDDTTFTFNMDIGYYDAKDFSIIKGPFIQNQTQTSTSIVSELLFPGTTQIFYREKVKNDWMSEKSKNASSISTVRIQNLKPDTEYEYYVKASYPNINPPSSCESDIYSFKTFPKKGRPFSFLVIGDNRTRTEVFTEVCKKINEEKQSEFILHTGDLVSNGRYYERWANEFFTPSKKLLAGKSIWIAIGNHEENSPLYYDFFNLPGNERYYHFDFLNSRFIALDSNLDYEKNSPQYNWLEQTLKNSQKNNIENIFIFTHHAIYTSSNHGKLDTNGIPVEKPIYIGQRDLIPLFEKYSVTAVFAGHDHTYERSLKNGITYITAGGGGAPLYKKSENAEKQNPYSKFFKSTEHYLIVSVNENSITINAKDITGNIFDEYEIKK